MKFSRAYETQADLNGAHVMARAGYDPRDMANMFKTIEAQGGSSGPEWLSDHPNPGNRYQRINQEAALLKITATPAKTRPSSIACEARLKGMSPALTAAQIAQNQKNGTINNGTSTTGPSITAPLERRAARSTSSRRLAASARISRAPRCASACRRTGSRSRPPTTRSPTRRRAPTSRDNGNSAFTHGVEVGITQGTGNLQRDTDSLLRNFAQGNPQLRQSGNSKNDSVGGRSGITIPLANVSEVTGQPEYISLSTTQLRDGSLLYVIGVAPRTEAGTYDNTFKKIRQSIQISDK